MTRLVIFFLGMSFFTASCGSKRKFYQKPGKRIVQLDSESLSLTGDAPAVKEIFLENVDYSEIRKSFVLEGTEDIEQVVFESYEEKFDCPQIPVTSISLENEAGESQITTEYAMTMVAESKLNFSVDKVFGCKSVHIEFSLAQE